MMMTTTRSTLMRARETMRADLGLFVMCAATLLLAAAVRANPHLGPDDVVHDDGMLLRLREERGEPLVRSLLPLPYDMDALDPFLTEENVRFHYQVHHFKYVDTVNEMCASLAYESCWPLAEGDDDSKAHPERAALQGISRGRVGFEDVMLEAQKRQNTPLFNAAAQAFNHDFFWHSMTPDGGGGEPEEQLYQAIEASFGSFDDFRHAFSTRAKKFFGSGWAWLAADVHPGDKKVRLVLMVTPNGETPSQDPTKTPLLCLDLWEHAYYPTYGPTRRMYVDSFLNNAVNWRFASANYQAVLDMTQSMRDEL